MYHDKIEGLTEMVFAKSVVKKDSKHANIAGKGPGEQVELVGVDAVRSLQGRLLALGLIKGAMITVISNEGSGPLLIKVGESRLTIGRGMAERIQVR